MATVKEYSVEEKLASLLTLQKVESKLDEIAILKGELPIEVRDLEDEIEGLHARETRLEEEVNGINEFIKQKKEAIAHSEDLIKKYEKQSDNVKNNREFEAINKELEMQTLDVKLCERHIKDASEEITEKARVLEAAKKNIAAKEANLKVKKGELDKIVAETEKEENFDTLSEQVKTNFQDFNIVSIGEENSKSILHKLSHQHLHIKFWNVKVNGHLPNGINSTDLKSYPFPIVLHNFIEAK